MAIDSSSSAINHEVDDTEILDHKNTDEVLRKNNAVFWETIATNLERKGVLWKERVNRRLSGQISNIFITN